MRAVAVDDGPADDPAPIVADPQPSEAFLPRYDARLPVNFDVQVAEVSAQNKALAQQLRMGEINFEDYQAQQQEITARREELEAIRLKAEIAGEMNNQARGQHSFLVVDRFFKATARAGGFDFAMDEAKRDDLEGFVGALAANPANANKDVDWLLSEAHKRVTALHGAAPKSTKAPESPVSPALDDAPGSEDANDYAGEFNRVDSLQGFDFESALHRMTPDQRERYARGE